MTLDPMALAGARAAQDQHERAIQDTASVWPHNALLVEDDRICLAVLDEISQPRQNLRPKVTLLWRATGRATELVAGDDVEGVVFATASRSTELQCDRCERLSPTGSALVVPFPPRLVVLVVCLACRADLANGFHPIRFSALPTARED